MFQRRAQRKRQASAGVRVITVAVEERCSRNIVQAKVVQKQKAMRSARVRGSACKRCNEYGEVQKSIVRGGVQGAVNACRTRHSGMACETQNREAAVAANATLSARFARWRKLGSKPRMPYKPRSLFAAKPNGVFVMPHGARR